MVLSTESAYRRMAIIRQFEERCLRLSQEGIIKGSIHLCLGQEAIPVGVCSALEERDRVIATYRGHGWAIARGVPLEALLAEICQRAGGTNGGRCGSPLLSAPEYGFLGENSIVGAGVPIADGVAMASVAQGTDRVVVVSIGEGAMNQGSVAEALVFAASKDLPLVVVCENNGWAEMTDAESLLRVGELSARTRALGISAEVVDGVDPIAVLEASKNAIAVARRGEGPVFLECKTVRLGGHYNADIQHYRPAENLEDARVREPLARLRSSGRIDGSAADDIDAEVAQVIDTITAAVSEMDEPDPSTAGEHIVADLVPERPVSGSGEEVTLTYQLAVNRALADELESRPEVLVYGEDVGRAGGIFGVSRRLQRQFGESRVFDTPISESAILGSAVGAAMEGMRPVVEIMWGDFMLVALDQVINQAANVRFINRSALSAPMVVRFQQGATPGSCAQHSQSLEAIYAHIPGLKFGAPATPQDAYAMTRAAIADPDPVLLAEARELYQTQDRLVVGGMIGEVGGARIDRDGDDVAIITWGAMLHRVRDAAERLEEIGHYACILDLRWLRPLDDAAIDEVVRRCGGKVIVAHEANLTGGFGGEIAARITERHFAELACPVRRIGARDVRVPAASSLQAAVIPSSGWVFDAALEMLEGEVIPGFR